MVGRHRFHRSAPSPASRVVPISPITTVGIFRLSDNSLSITIDFRKPILVRNTKTALKHNEILWLVRISTYGMSLGLESVRQSITGGGKNGQQEFVQFDRRKAFA